MSEMMSPRSGRLAVLACVCTVQLLSVAALPAIAEALTKSARGFPHRELSSFDSCGGVNKVCTTCDAITARSVMSRESTSIRVVLNAMVEDVKLMRAQIEDLLLKGGVASVRTSLELCDDGPGSLRPPDYCGEGSSEICPGNWNGSVTCAEVCEDRDWGNIMRNWSPGTYVGHADCALGREAELWAGTVFMEDLRERFVVDGNDIDDTGHNGSWIGNRTREIDLAIADNLRNLMPKLAARNPVASAAWAGLSSDAWVYWPPLPSFGVGNWNMGDMMGVAALLGFDGSSHPERDMRSHVGEFVDVALPFFNPTRETVWTNPYEDPMGAGMMISVSQPWYFTGNFWGVEFKDAWLGAMGMDIVLQEQQALLSNLKLSQNAQCLIVNDNLNVMIAPDSVVQLIFNSREMQVANTVRTVPEVVPADCKVCCERLSPDCVMSLTEANSTDWAALKTLLAGLDAGTSQATTQQLFWPAFSTDDAAYQDKWVDTLFIFDRWSVDNVKAGQWSMLCMLPADELPKSIVTTIAHQDDLASRTYQATSGNQGNVAAIDLRANLGDTPEEASFTIANDGVLDLIISDIRASEALILTIATNSSSSSTTATSTTSVAEQLPIALPAGTSLTIFVTADTLASGLVIGDNDMSIDLMLEDDSYQDCSYKEEKTIDVYLFVLAHSCPVGSHLDDSGVCLLCASGTYKAGSGAESCLPCALGYSTNDISGAAECVACAVGYSTDNSKGMPLCVPCSRGTYTPEEGSHECAKCPLGQYQNSSAQTSCLSCGAGLVTLETGGSDEEECVCPSGTRWSNSSSSCEQCQEGLSCEWSPGQDWRVGSQMIPSLLPGYFALKEDPTNVWLCHANHKRCPGGPAGRCARNRKENSFICSTCEPGHKSSVDGSCAECVGADIIPAVFLAVLMILVLGGVYYLADREDRAKQTKSTLLMVLISGLTLNLYQQFSVLSLMPFQWPEPFSGLLKALSVFSFDLDVLSLNCFATVSPFADYAMRVCLVLAMFFVLALIHLMASLLFHSGDILRRSSTFWGSAGSVFIALMLSILAGLLAPLQCQVHPNGLSTMLSDDAVVCWEDYFASTDHGSMVKLSLAACLMPITFGVIAVKAVLELPKRLKRGDAQFLRTYFFLFSRFRMECYWYVLLMTGRNMLVALVPALPDVTLQWCVLSLLSLASLVVATTIRPWRCAEANHLDIFLTIGLLVEMGVAALVIEGTDLSFLGWCAFVVAVGLLGGILFFGFSIAMHRFRQGKAFQYFLCHHKHGAGNFARLLKLHLLAHKHTQRKVFVDSDDLEDLSKLFSLVRNETERLILLGSRDVLRRSWCVGEVTVAMVNEVPINILSWPDFPQIDACAIDKYVEAANSQLAQHGIDAPMMRRALEHLAKVPMLTMAKDITNAAVAGIANSLAGLRVRPVRSPNAAGLHAQSLPLSRTNDDSTDFTSSEHASSTLGETVLKGRKSAVGKMDGSQAGRVLLCDQTSPEATCTACIIQRLLVPHLAEVVHILERDELPSKTVSQQVIMVCTNGLFEQRHAIRVLWAGSEAKADFLVCTCEPAFRFPTEAFYEGLRQSSLAVLSAFKEDPCSGFGSHRTSLTSQKSNATSATNPSEPPPPSPDLLVLIVKTIFEEIALEVNPQDHENVLALRIQTLAGRLLEPERSSNGEEQRSRVLRRSIEEQGMPFEQEGLNCEEDVHTDDESEGGVVTVI